jgi:hypothetical protein
MSPSTSATTKCWPPTSKPCIASRKSSTSRARLMRRNASSSAVGENPVYCTESAVPAAVSTDSSGPLLRRGTMSVWAGIAPPGGTTSSASCRPGVRGLTRNVSSTATTGSSLPWYTVDSLLGVVGSDRICSMYVSVTSMRCWVAPNAMCRLWPRMTYGAPGRLSPWMSNPPPRRSIGCHTDGASRPRCGSLARIGRPFAVCRPPMTHEFEPRSPLRFNASAIRGACFARSR